MPTATAACAHHWVIETPRGALSNGRCKLCGETRDFPNSRDYGIHEGRRDEVRLSRQRASREQPNTATAGLQERRSAGVHRRRARSRGILPAGTTGKRATAPEARTTKESTVTEAITFRRCDGCSGDIDWDDIYQRREWRAGSQLLAAGDFCVDCSPRPSWGQRKTGARVAMTSGQGPA